MAASLRPPSDPDSLGQKDAGLEDPPRPRWYVRLANSLAGRLLGLTVVLVLMAEVLVFTPSLARFHEAWVQDRVNLAHIAAMAQNDREGDIADALRRDLREQARVLRIQEDDSAAPPILLAPTSISKSDQVWDYTAAGALERGRWALSTLFAPPGRIILVRAAPRFADSQPIALTLDESVLQQAARAYAAQLAVGSTIVSVIAGAVVYAMLIGAFVRPMRRLTRNVERFRRRPSDPTRNMPLTTRRDEIGRAERAIRAMQGEIQASLRQRERLAELGGAIARVAHDLRNMLATAQLVTQRIATSNDPEVRAAAPRLERAIGRAAGLASSALRYGKAEESAPVLQALSLEEAVCEAFADALASFSEINGVVGPGLAIQVIADPDHLHRVLTNLIRNAAQAVRSASAHKPDFSGVVTITARQVGGRAAIRIADDGCGMPARTVERLFQPFASGGGRSEGNGLGLAIARELARAQGGDLELEATGPDGSAFQLTLPAA